MNPILAGLIAIVLLAINGFFTAAEFSLLAARRSRIEQLAAEGSRGAIAAQRGQRELSFMLAGAQLGITVSSLGIGDIAEPAVAHVLEDAFEGLGMPTGLVNVTAVAIALVVVVFVHMVFAEMAPKSWSITAPDRSAVLLARPFRAFVRLFHPFLAFLNAMANGVLRLVGVTPADESTIRGPAELAVLLEDSVETGTMAMSDADRLSGALELSGLVVSDVMVPRGAIEAVSARATLDQVEDAAVPRRRSRLLVYGRNLDDVRGVIHVRDLLALAPDERYGRRADDFVYSVVSLPVNMPLEDVLLTLQRERRHLAIVVDGHRLVGMLTMQDVLRHLIGRRPAPRR